MSNMKSALYSIGKVVIVHKKQHKSSKRGIDTRSLLCGLDGVLVKFDIYEYWQCSPHNYAVLEDLLHCSFPFRSFLHIYIGSVIQQYEYCAVVHNINW